jgi:hypothetical protein
MGETNNSEIEMHVDDLAEFLYVKNKSNARINLDLQGIEDIKDLFCFCIDLLCKGLIYVCNNTNIDLDTITEDKFKLTSDKLSRTGIQTNLSINPNIENLPSQVDMGIAFTNPAITNLCDHEFKIVTINNVYKVKFEIIDEFA